VEPIRIPEVERPMPEEPETEIEMPPVSQPLTLETLPERQREEQPVR